jgi:hypothetical protein
VQTTLTAVKQVKTNSMDRQTKYVYTAVLASQTGDRMENTGSGEVR